MSPALAILLTLIAYKVVLITIGIVAQRRTCDTVDYLIGGRRLGPVVAAVSASASSSSAWTLLGVSGFAYDRGLAALWLFPACVGGFVFNWLVLAAPLRRLAHEREAVTTTDILAGAAGAGSGSRSVRVIASVIILVSLATYVAAQFQGAGKTLAETFELSMTWSILIGGAVVVLYTMLGGFWAVSLTDTLQGLVMAAASVILPLAALLWVGPANLGPGLAQVPIEGYLSPWQGMAAPAAVGFILGLLGIGIGYPGQPHVVNRFMALRAGDAEMRLARCVAIGWAVVVFAGMILLGLCARVGFEPVDDGERVFITVASTVLGPVVAGVMIAAVLSAVMSTADSQLLVAAGTVTHDLGVGGRRHMLSWSRVVVLVLSGAAVVAALRVDETIFDRVLFAWSSMGCAFGPLLLVTVLRGPVTRGGTLASMTLGFSLSVAAYLGKGAAWVPAGWAGVGERIVPFVVALAIALACSRRRR